MNKRGKVFLTTQEFIEMGFWTFLIIFYFFLIYVLVNTAVAREVDIGNIVNEIYADRLIYASSCTAFNDTLRSYIGVIDAAKVNSERLGACLSKTYFSARLTVAYNNKKLEAYNNKDVYLLNSRLCFDEKYKCGVASPLRYVAVFDNGTVYPGAINMSVVYHEI